MNTVQDTSFGIVPIYKGKDGNFLFCVVRHSSGQHWGFPKGHPQTGETVEETARRELFEETGIDKIDIVPNREITESYSFEKNGVRHNKTVKYFIGFAHTVEICTQENFQKEIIGIQWLPYPELIECLTFSEAKEVAAKADEYIHKQI